MADIYQMF